MKTRLYRDMLTDKLFTIAEYKDAYEFEHNCDLPVDEDTILSILNGQLYPIGNIRMIKNDILVWCNDYADYNEADRYLSKDEKDISVRDIYEYVLSRDTSFIKDMKEYMDDKNGIELLNRLEKLTYQDL